MDRLRVLLVEDDKASFAGTLAELRDEGPYLIEVADNLEEALRALRDRPYDLLILDWRLPRDGRTGTVDDRAGERVVTALASGDCYPGNGEMPFVVITGQRPAVDLAKCRGLSGFVGSAEKLNLDAFDAFWAQAVAKATAKGR